MRPNLQQLANDPGSTNRHWHELYRCRKKMPADLWYCSCCFRPRQKVKNMDKEPQSELIVIRDKAPHPPRLGVIPWSKKDQSMPWNSAVNLISLKIDQQTMDIPYIACFSFPKRVDFSHTLLVLWIYFWPIITPTNVVRLIFCPASIHILQTLLPTS